MSGKVIHIDETIHKLAREFCSKNKIHLSVWVGLLIVKETQSNTQLDRTHDLSVYTKTKKKALDKLSMEQDKDIWSKPPFWTNNDAGN